MTIKHINPATIYDGAGHGLSQATIATGLGLVFISGQVDWSRDLQIQNTTVEGQAESAMKNLQMVLEAANSSIADVLQVRVYVRGEVTEKIEQIAPVLVKYFGKTRPALTGVGVASLASPDLLIEIEAIAQVSSV